jgi:hypothetical protein
MVFPGARTAQRQAVNAAMSNDFIVQSVAAARPANNAFSEARTAAIQSPSRPEPSSPQPPAMPIPNPTLRFDPGLGLVVIEFYSTSGAVTTSVPSQRQIHEYQKWNATHLGQTPDGISDTGAPPSARPEPVVKNDTQK